MVLPAVAVCNYGFVIVACCCLMMGVNVGLTFSCAGIFMGRSAMRSVCRVGEFGIYMSVMYVTSTLMLSVAGGMLERWSARWLFTGASLLMGLTFIAMGMFDDVRQFYVAGGVWASRLHFCSI